MELNLVVNNLILTYPLVIFKKYLKPNKIIFWDLGFLFGVEFLFGK